jgi:hypothetical protein
MGGALVWWYVGKHCAHTCLYRPRSKGDPDETCPGGLLQLRLSAVALVKFGIIIRRPQRMVGASLRRSSRPTFTTTLYAHM